MCSGAVFLNNGHKFDLIAKTTGNSQHWYGSDECSKIEESKRLWSAIVSATPVPVTF